MAKEIVLNAQKQFVSFINPFFNLSIPEGYTKIVLKDEEIPERLSSSHYFIDNKWVYIPPKTTDLDQVENAWRYIRGLRNDFLTQSDWTQMPDVSLTTKEAWASYRQALRDITNQIDPFNIVWPTPPN